MEEFAISCDMSAVESLCDALAPSENPPNPPLAPAEDELAAISAFWWSYVAETSQETLVQKSALFGRVTGDLKAPRCHMCISDDSIHCIRQNTIFPRSPPLSSDRKQQLDL